MADEKQTNAVAQAPTTQPDPAAAPAAAPKKTKKENPKGRKEKRFGFDFYIKG